MAAEAFEVVEDQQPEDAREEGDVGLSNGHRLDHLPDSRYAAIYARVSTEDQGKGYSIPTQIKACQKHTG